MGFLLDHPSIFSDSAWLLHSLEYIGVFGNAFLGGGVARRYGLSPIGFAVLAILSALGGGIVRDTMLQQGAPIAFTHWSYLSVALVAAALAYLVVEELRIWTYVAPYVDALALGCFASVGAHKTLLLGFDWLPAILLGAVTAVGGGVIRDIAVGRVPMIFGRNVYALCAVAASAVMVVLQLGGHSRTGLALGTLVGAVLCLLARKRNWQLPAPLIGTPEPAVVPEPRLKPVGE